MKGRIKSLSVLEWKNRVNRDKVIRSARVTSTLAAPLSGTGRLT